MASNYPTTSIDNFTDPASGDFLNTAGVIHNQEHDDVNRAIFNIETKVGLDASATTTTIDYLLKNAASVNPGHHHKEDALNLGAFTTNNVTSGIHGFAPASNNNISQFLNNGNPPAYATAIAQLASVAGVALSTSTATTLYTVPTARTAIIEHVAVRNANVSLTTASVSFGFNSASFNDVITDATHTELTTNTLYTQLYAKLGAAIGAAAANFSVKANTTQSTATVTIDVFGYLF